MLRCCLIPILFHPFLFTESLSRFNSSLIPVNSTTRDSSDSLARKNFENEYISKLFLDDLSPSSTSLEDGELESNLEKLLRVDDIFSWEIWGYSLVVPLICLVGVLTNSFSLFVFFLGDLKESHYTYLTVLAVADLVTVILVLFSGIARGVGRTSFVWALIDAFLHIPIASVSTTVSILTLVTVTLERLSIIKFPIESRRFCTPSNARKNCWVIFIFSLLFNIPYCLIFIIKDGNIIYSDFGSTQYYKFHNWVRLIILGFLPGIIFVVSNILLLFSLRKNRKRRISLLKPSILEVSDSQVSSRSFLPECYIEFNRSESEKDSTSILPAKVLPNSSNTLIVKQSDKNQHRRITLVLIAMIFSFLIGEFPTHIASRSSAVSLIFPSEPHLFDEQNFRIFKLVATILMSCHYSGNFFLYCAFNRRFIRELKCLWIMRVKTSFYKPTSSSKWNSDTSNETCNKSIAVSPMYLRKQNSRRKRKYSTITRVSVNIGLSKKKTYLESHSIEEK